MRIPLRMTLSGYFDVSQEVAESMWINLELFGESYTISGLYHYRDNVYSSHIENPQ